MRCIYAHKIHTSLYRSYPMLNTSSLDNLKRPINLSLNVKMVETAKALGMNLSQTVDQLLGEEVKRRYWAQWKDDNRVAIEEYNERIAQEGLPLEKHRTF